jgi:hypothetical protein
MSTQTSFAVDSVTRYNPFRSVGANHGQTDVGNAVRQRDIFRSTPSWETGAEVIDDGAHRLRLSTSERVVPTEKKELKKAVDGVVGKYDEITVNCDLRLGDRLVTIQLPRALFPQELSYGLPITVEMIEDGGIRRPVITTRQIDRAATEAMAKEFDAILEQL